MTLLMESAPLSGWDGWEVMELDAASWRISDPSREPDDATRLIAYAEMNVGGTIDVLWLTAPAPHVTRFNSLDDAFVAWRHVRDFDNAEWPNSDSVAWREATDGHSEAR